MARWMQSQTLHTPPITLRNMISHCYTQRYNTRLFELSNKCKRVSWINVCGCRSELSWHKVIVGEPAVGIIMRAQPFHQYKFLIYFYKIRVWNTALFASAVTSTEWMPRYWKDTPWKGDSLGEWISLNLMGY